MRTGEKPYTPMEKLTLHLIVVIGLPKGVAITYDGMAELVRKATPEQRCLAYLRALFILPDLADAEITRDLVRRWALPGLPRNVA